MRIQLCPALIDWIVFLVLFAVLYSAGARGLTDNQCAWLGAIGLVTYTVSAVALLVSMLVQMLVASYPTAPGSTVPDSGPA